MKFYSFQLQKIVPLSENRHLGGPNSEELMKVISHFTSRFAEQLAPYGEAREIE